MHSGPAVGMNIDLRTLDPREGYLEDTHDVHFVDAFGEEVTVRCRVSIDYRHTGSAWYFNGVVKAGYVTACHLCLAEVSLPVEETFELVVRRSGDPDATGADDEDYLVLPLGESVVSLDALVHENFVVGIPMIVRCREDCRGLCPQCGVNLNNETCSCEKPTDSRWDALRKMGERGQ
jgi:uncharacterized protein